TAPLFPYTTLFRSAERQPAGDEPDPLAPIVSNHRCRPSRGRSGEVPDVPPTRIGPHLELPDSERSGRPAHAEHRALHSGKERGDRLVALAVQLISAGLAVVIAPVVEHLLAARPIADLHEPLVGRLDDRHVDDEIGEGMDGDRQRASSGRVYLHPASSRERLDGPHRSLSVPTEGREPAISLNLVPRW